MNGSGSEDFRFILEQMARQHQDLKADFRIEMASLGHSLLNNLTAHSLEDEVRFKETSRRLSTLERPFWALAGAGSLLFIVLEMGFRSFDYFHK